MSKDKISDYSATANSNTDIGGINIDEGCAPSGINDAIRTLMKQLKDWQSGSQDVYIHPAGSASVPSITATGDTNTGIFFPAADTVGIATGGTERMRLDSAGRLGIGSTPTPASYQNINGYFQNGRSGWAYVVDDSANTHLVHNLIFNGTNNVRAGTGYSSRFSIIDSDGSFRWYQAGTGSSGATASLSTNMTLDASGNLGVGSTAPSSDGVSGYANLVIGNSSASASGITMRTNNSGSTTQGIIWARGTGGANGFVKYDHYNDVLTLGAGGSERARIDSSGNLLVGTTSQFGYGKICLSLNPASSDGYVTRPTSNNNYNAALFQNSSGTTVGNITCTGSATSYVTSSDYRLKENIAPMTGALATVAQLKPCTYTWKADGSSADGFIAHELAEVCPQAVVGEKDAVDADGNPVYQGIDTSFLVATLTAAIQEQQAIITQLQADVAALKG